MLRVDFTAEATGVAKQVCTDCPESASNLEVRSSRMKKIPLLGVLLTMPLAVMPLPAQQPKFELADVHLSTTPRWFAGNLANPHWLK
jgi:hypothetical protein